MRKIKKNKINTKSRKKIEIKINKKIFQLWNSDLFEYDKIKFVKLEQHITQKRVETRCVIEAKDFESFY